MDAIPPEMAVGLVGVIIAVLNFIFTYWRTSKSDAAALEKRFGKVESDVRDLETRLKGDIRATAFTEDDRKCLHALSEHDALWWGVVKKEFPKILMQLHTPGLDQALNKFLTSGYALPRSEALELFSMLNREWEKANEFEDAAGRRIAIALFKGFLELELKLTPEEKVACKS